MQEREKGSKKKSEVRNREDKQKTKNKMVDLSLNIIITMNVTSINILNILKCVKNIKRLEKIYPINMEGRSSYINIR